MTGLQRQHHQGSLTVDQTQGIQHVQTTTGHLPQHLQGDLLKDQLLTGNQPVAPTREILLVLIM